MAGAAYHDKSSSVVEHDCCDSCSSLTYVDTQSHRRSRNKLGSSTKRAQILSRLKRFLRPFNCLKQPPSDERRDYITSRSLDEKLEYFNNEKLIEEDEPRSSLSRSVTLLDEPLTPPEAPVSDSIATDPDVDTYELQEANLCITVAQCCGRLSNGLTLTDHIYKDLANIWNQYTLGQNARHQLLRLHIDKIATLAEDAYQRYERDDYIPVLPYSRFPRRCTAAAAAPNEKENPEKGTNPVADEWGNPYPQSLHNDISDALASYYLLTCLQFMQRDNPDRRFAQAAIVKLRALEYEFSLIGLHGIGNNDENCLQPCHDPKRKIPALKARHFSTKGPVGSHNVSINHLPSLSHLSLMVWGPNPAELISEGEHLSSERRNAITFRFTPVWGDFVATYWYDEYTRRRQSRMNCYSPCLDPVGFRHWMSEYRNPSIIPTFSSAVDENKVEKDRPMIVMDSREKLE